MAVKLDRWEGAEERSRDEVFAELYESSYPSLVKYCRGLRGSYSRVAAGAMAGLAYFPRRGARRRFGLWAHHTGQLAATSPALAARASDAVAAVVAIAVVSGAPVVNPLPQSNSPERPP